jgi:predicted nucleic acid-binding protein
VSPVLFDTSIYITVLRSEENPAQRLRALAGGAPIWLSAVVLEELYAGASGRSRYIVERLQRDFERAGRVLVPTLRDWTQTGKALSRLAAKYDDEQIRKGRLTNDTLLAASAARYGATIVTANTRDFARLAEFLSFGWRVQP